MRWPVMGQLAFRRTGGCWCQTIAVRYDGTYCEEQAQACQLDTRHEPRSAIGQRRFGEALALRSVLAGTQFNQPLKEAGCFVAPQNEFSCPFGLRCT